ncbi:UPF0235 protein C15orf40 homolog, partial [Pseudochaenichthys georgianus]|uniref:UPF0235 protein C15orf40 homolog n=1 Tax=Pseudochaenichthys georgianus TaxID=52239 RepID=UPI0039C44D00
TEEGSRGERRGTEERGEEPRREEGNRGERRGAEERGGEPRREERSRGERWGAEDRGGEPRREVGSRGPRRGAEERGGEPRTEEGSRGERRGAEDRGGEPRREEGSRGPRRGTSYFLSKGYISAEAVGVSIAAPPTDGEANTELIRYLAEVLDLKKSHISLDKGSRSRDKVIRVDSSLSPEEVMRRIREEAG